MDEIAKLLASLNTSNWIAIVALLVSAVFGCFTAANYLAGRRERVQKRYDATPIVAATINRDSYASGWRSVQLHIAPPEDQPDFKYHNWSIKRAVLLRP
jgi:hypothetical protein